MKIATKFLFGIFTFSILISSMALAQPTIDGSKSGDSDYIKLGEWTQANTGFGDHGIKELLAYSDASDLYIMVVGEIESNFNELFIFIGVTSESNVTAGTQLPTGSDGSSPFNSLNPTLDFDASFGIRMTSGNSSNAFPSIIDYRSSGNTDTFLTTIANDGTSSTISSGVYNGTVVAYDDTGTLSSNTGVEGFEIKIPLSALGGSAISDGIRLMAMYGNDDFISANTIPEISGQSGTNLGSDPNFNSISGVQHSAYSYAKVSGDAGWRLLSLPKASGTISDVSDDTPVQGVTGGDDASADANFIIYDDDATFEQPTNVSTSWGDGYGFGLYFYDNTTNGSSELPVTLDAFGAEPTSDVAVTLNPATSGYTLVGNPFASNFNTNNLVASTSAIQNTIHFWNGSSYVGQDRTASSGFIISPWQGFWVQKDATANTGTLTFPVSGKTTSDTTGTYYKAVGQHGDIQFTLTSESTIDEAIRIAFRSDASFDYDLDDSGKLIPLLPAYATMAFKSNEMLKSVESLPYNLEEEITLSLQPQVVGVSGEFTFGWNGLETIPSDWELTLHDYDTGENINMRAASEYVFTVGAQAKANPNPLSLLSGPAAVAMKAKAEANRFGITIRPTSVSNETEDSPAAFALEQNYPNPFNPSTTISYSVQEAGAVSISVYNLMGQKVATLVDETKEAGQYNVRWNAAGAASGMYYYRLEAGGQSITRKMTLIK